jgi:hypothetical protein
MKAKDLRWFLLGYIVLLLVAMNVRSDEMIGINANWANGDYSFRAGSAPWAIAFAVVGLGLYIALAMSKVSASVRTLPDLFRRWIAGMIDFVWSLLVPGAFAGLVAVLIEYRRTGAFEWLVDRQEPQPSDWPLAIAFVLLLMFVIMPGYLALLWRRGKPTPGSCICNFRVAVDDGCSLPFWKADLRALLGSMALLAWPCWILAYSLRRDKAKGKFWLDVIFRTHAEFLE